MYLKHYICSILLVLCNFICVDSYINGITQHNIQSYIDSKKFLIVFINSASCTRCKNIYKNFVSASMPFHGDREIFFGKTTDMKLIKKWNIEELPAIVYFPMGLSEPQRFEGEYTVDNIIDTISYVMSGDFRGLERAYYVEVNEENFEELIEKPQQHAMVLIYDQFHEEQKGTMKELAKLFREEDDLVIAVLDADKNKAFRDKKFNFPGAPLLYWFPIDNKYKIKRFGGDLTFEVLYSYINEQTHTWRNKDGTLLPKAGRFDDLDKIISQNVGGVIRADQEVMDSVIEEVGKVVDKLDSNQQEFGKFYIYLMQQIKTTGNTKFIRNETDVIFKELQDLDLMSKKRDNLIKRHHILDFLVKEFGDYITKNPMYMEEVKKDSQRKVKADSHSHDEL
ncbi:hypothetical protein LOTGIDRAFT_203703 [Lottia gigantea]|uniref:protein disulfide-isomerase n=1 Tax=Lottia gigantea TaxID=225164 RepID=V4AX97_LOTGI|nr:hypothetical protein LOTGIDRAFT_203703 [Lottia gigantea]ESO98191.1 hypothetical protein LOTGIDRAFT_203703 [Lottia gigantea]